MKTIGILGGLGPGAGAQLYQNIINQAQSVYSAHEDDEHPPVVLHTTALSGFDAAASLTNPDTKQELLTALQGIEAAGADFVVIACNTVHLLYDELQARLNMPLLHLIKEVVRVIPQDCKTVGVLSSAQSTNESLYSHFLKQAGINVLTPTAKQQDRITQVISTVMAGTHGVPEKNVLEAIMADLHQKGAEMVVLGCTELPLAVSPEDISGIPIIDSLDVAAGVCLARALQS